MIQQSHFGHWDQSRRVRNYIDLLVFILLGGMLVNFVLLNDSFGSGNIFNKVQ